MIRRCMAPARDLGALPEVQARFVEKARKIV